MRERIKLLLEEITSNRQLESRWLNTLSLMEFIGARKISRTVADSHPSADVLEHWADETRHAVVFKKLANRVCGREETGYLGEKAAKTYFFKLDRELSAWAAEMAGEESTRLNYLLVTTMIERRAMVLYPLYRAASATDDVRVELLDIIDEERTHRAAIESRCVELLNHFGVETLSAPEAVESAFFIEFLSDLEREVDQGATRMSA